MIQDVARSGIGWALAAGRSLALFAGAMFMANVAGGPESAQANVADPNGITARYLVPDLSPDVTEDVLIDYFSGFGELEECTVKHHGQGRVLGSVRFANPTEALRAELLGGPHMIAGVPVQVKTWKMMKGPKHGGAAGAAGAATANASMNKGMCTGAGGNRASQPGKGMGGGCCGGGRGFGKGVGCGCGGCGGGVGRGGMGGCGGCCGGGCCGGGCCSGGGGCGGGGCKGGCCGGGGGGCCGRYGKGAYGCGGCAGNGAMFDWSDPWTNMMWDEMASCYASKGGMGMVHGGACGEGAATGGPYGKGGCSRGGPALLCGKGGAGAGGGKAGKGDADIAARFLLANLNENTTDEDIREYFGQFGDVEDVTIKHTQAGKTIGSKGSVKFVQAACSHELRNLMLKNQHVIKNVVVVVQTYKMQKLAKADNKAIHGGV